MIVEYEEKYLEDVRDLLVELEEYILTIDKDNLDQLHPEYREKMALLELKEAQEYNGKCFLAIEDGKVIGVLTIGDIAQQEDISCEKLGETFEGICGCGC